MELYHIPTNEIIMYKCYFQSMPNSGSGSSISTGSTDVGAGQSLGAFGGYQVWGFDHSIDNIPGQYSLTIKGNAFGNWHEPGIVWVMQGENGNGRPDDTWYELAGNLDGTPFHKQQYAVCYNNGNTWADNTGDSGSFPRVRYALGLYAVPLRAKNHRKRPGRPGLVASS
jgi:hypothetical protein